MALPTDRFEARGTGPKWTLRIDSGELSFDHGYGRKQYRYKGSIDKVERSAGRISIAATVYVEQAVPLSGKTWDGRSTVHIEYEREPLSIAVNEVPCIDEKRRRFPTRVSVTFADEQQYRGCGNPLPSLEAVLLRRNRESQP